MTETEQFQNHKKFVMNFDMFMKGLPSSRVKVMFFYAQGDDNTPRLIDEEFGLFIVNGKKWFVMNGIQSSQRPGGARYAYLYQESVIRYLVTIEHDVPGYYPHSEAASVKKRGIPITSGNRDDRGDVNHGDHLDIGFFFSPKQDATILKFHKTEYLHNNSFNFDRFMKECNFTFSSTNRKIDSFENFKFKHCEDVKGLELQTTLGSTDVGLADDELLALYEVCKLVYDNKNGGKPTKSYYMYKNRRYLIHNGKRGGKYILKSDGSKVYIQQYGRNQHHGGNDITFLSETFKSFINEMLVLPVMKKFMYNPPPSTYPENIIVTLLWDEHNTLSANANEYFTLIYDFNHFRNVFRVKSSIAFNACYADGYIKRNKSDVGLEPIYKADLRTFEMIRTECLQQAA